MRGEIEYRNRDLRRYFDGLTATVLAPGTLRRRVAAVRASAMRLALPAAVVVRCVIGATDTSARIVDPVVAIRIPVSLGRGWRENGLMETGRLPNSHGRSVTISSSILHRLSTSECCIIAPIHGIRLRAVCTGGVLAGDPFGVVGLASGRWSGFGRRDVSTGSRRDLSRLVGRREPWRTIRRLLFQSRSRLFSTRLARFLYIPGIFGRVRRCCCFCVHPMVYFSSLSLSELC